MSYACSFQEISITELRDINGGGPWDSVKEVFQSLPQQVKPIVVVPAAAMVLYEGGKKIGGYAAEAVYWIRHF